MLTKLSAAACGFSGSFACALLRMKPRVRIAWVRNGVYKPSMNGDGDEPGSQLPLQLKLAARRCSLKYLPDFRFFWTSLSLISSPSNRIRLFQWASPKLPVYIDRLVQQRVNPLERSVLRPLVAAQILTLTPLLGPFCAKQTALHISLLQSHRLFLKHALHNSVLGPVLLHHFLFCIWSSQGECF